jgi:hypothetical protein
MVAWWSMGEFPGHHDPSRPNREGHAAEAIESGARLHALALRYWAAGRLADALRIDLQAAELVGALEPNPEPPLLLEITSAIEAIRRELQASGEAR